ncbi:G-patch domain-containing protein [Beauveria bassiana ARSEF 2860]|uniref:G-patch domain-containing protein n=1 Tax=Beauveria bassiana (strain ARSEF 2860) TaxID=655819 RepID=J4KP90_BEAB2|nr:G-patch domain-containing protein [Beauveria bassiana ARSEF 2860]EJP67039.1 G-patch domain-containing protein [Beauveria bassiana ARSEF 2860]
MSATDQPGLEAQDDEDYYMNMTFDNPQPPKETSIQRTQRLKKESRARGVIKSKAQIAQEEADAREKALAKSMLDDPRAKKSKGLAMMAKMGFTGGGLGKKTADGLPQGRTEPIHLSLKDDRGGVGMDAEKKRRFREAAEEQGIAPDAKAPRLDPDEYRERVRKEREDAKLEKQFFAAQRMAERMAEEEVGAKDDGSDDSTEQDDKRGKKTHVSAKPLKSVPILYRGLVRHREEKERDRRMRHDLEQSLSRLPMYEEEDDDPDYKTALGKPGAIYTVAEDLDEEDAELDQFNALDVRERLERLLKHLREQHRYCFWCKMVYPDAEMDGCPGLTEEDHD